MTFTQLEYIVAIDNTRHFARAAAQCFVTQPTLSMQVQKLEDELGLKLFDRAHQPVVVTDAGKEIIAQARKILAERHTIEDLVQVQKGVLQGVLSIGIIPTLAPYLLPLFIASFTKKYPNIKLVVTELTTKEIINALKEGRLDAGLLVTPLNENGLTEEPLFYEELVAYVAKANKAYKKQYVLPADIDAGKLWLLEEGHCFRSQIVNLCELRRQSKEGSQFEYEAGSIETLRRLVEVNDGITIIPELATLDMTARQLGQLRHFKSPAPVRQVSLVTYRNGARRRLLQALQQSILGALPPKIKKNKSKGLVPLVK